MFINITTFGNVKSIKKPILLTLIKEYFSVFFAVINKHAIINFDNRIVGLLKHYSKSMIIVRYLCWYLICESQTQSHRTSMALIRNKVLAYYIPDGVGQVFFSLRLYFFSLYFVYTKVTGDTKYF